MYYGDFIMYGLSGDPLFSHFTDHLGLWVRLCTGDVHLSHTTQTYGSSPASRFSAVCQWFCSVSAKHALPSSPKSPIRAIKLAARLAGLGVPRISVMFRVPVPCVIGGLRNMGCFTGFDNGVWLGLGGKAKRSLFSCFEYCIDLFLSLRTNWSVWSMSAVA